MGRAVFSAADPAARIRELAALAAGGKLVWEKHAGAREIFSGLLQKIGGGA